MKLLLFITLVAASSFAKNKTNSDSSNSSAPKNKSESANSAALKSHSEHREYGAHVHGAGTLMIAFDKTIGKIEFKVAAESILGFEHFAKSEKDKKAVSEITALFEKKIEKIVQLDSSLQCKYSKDTIEQVAEAGEKGSGEHSNWMVTYSLSCAKSPIGTKITVDLTDFKRIHDLDITILADSIQKAAEYNGKKPVAIELK